MKDISLYGHLTIDTIIDGVKERKTLGSMANVWKALLELDATLDIGLSPIDVGQALIYIDKPAAQRYSKVQLSLVEHQAKIYSSKIHHLIYLNELTKTDFIPALDGIIAADICPGTNNGTTQNIWSPKFHRVARFHLEAIFWAHRHMVLQPSHLLTLPPGRVPGRGSSGGPEGN